MGLITEGLRTGEHLVSEANGYRSREQITLLAGLYVASQVLGRVATSAAAAAAVGGNSGNGAMGAVTTGTDAIQGVYLVKLTKAAANAGDFEVFDPQNDLAGVGTVGAAFAGGGLAFTLADGSSDFVVGDSFRITVGAPVVKWKGFDPTATDGSQRARGVLLAAGGNAGAESRGVAHVRSCEVNGLIITWPTGISTAAKSQGIADLVESGIHVRV